MTTIKDVAREAGVSIATVSRVFNNSGLVSENTRQHVRAVAERLRFWPNSAARSLITNRTQTVGVLLPDLHGEFFSEVIRGVDRAARREGLHILLASSHSDTQEMVESLRSLRGRIDGLIIMAPDADAPPVLRENAWDCPVMLIGPAERAEDFETLSIANIEGARRVVEHLQSLGHERIAVITGPARNLDAVQRLEGYRAAMRARGSADTSALEIPGDFTEQAGIAGARTLLAMSPRPTAVFASNDPMALALLATVTAAGVRVPQDLAVAGFDDIVLSRYVTPPLTTVRVDAFGLGQRAVQRLVAQGSGPAPEHEIVPTTLVVRASCGAGLANTPPRA